MNRIRTLMIATLSFLLKISIPAISFYWRNDTPTFVTWQSSSPNQFDPEIFSPLSCSSRLVHNKWLFDYFFKELISFIGSLEKMPHQRFQRFDFCGICRRQCHYEFNTVFWKSCIVFCAKPTEVNPIKLISLRPVRLSITVKYMINNSVWK